MGARQPGLPSAGLCRHLPPHHSQRALLGPGAWYLGQGGAKVGTKKSLGSMVTGSVWRAQIKQKSNITCHGGWLH